MEKEVTLQHLYLRLPFISGFAGPAFGDISGFRSRVSAWFATR
jgi:hypothetical protein